MPRGRRQVVNSAPPETVVLLVGQNGRGILENIVQALKNKKTEFKNVRIEQQPTLPRDIPDNTAVILCTEKELHTCIHQLWNRSWKPAVVALMESYSSETIDRIFNYGYPALEGFFLQGTEDYEELGNLARIIKDAIRRYLAHRDYRITKAVGWKVKSKWSDEDLHARPLVTLFADRVMRNFMQDLLEILNTMGKFPKIPRIDVSQIQQIFTQIGLWRDGRVANNPENRAHEILRSQVLRQFQGPGRWFQPILLEGETGVGKSVVARWCQRYLTQYLGRSDLPFCEISIVNIPPNLLEGELFGVIPGTFTGAQPVVGRLLEGRGGVVFLDEIGDLSPETQVKLLYYLQTMEFMPQAWPYSWKVFCPAIVIAATNRDLRAAVRRGEFRQDLYHRFYHRLRVPSLRERKGDLRVLVDLLLQDPMINPDGWIQEIALDALVRLENYDYPGNFRELEAILAQAVRNARRAGRRVLLPEHIEFED